jgi:hypothetical protein
MRHCTPVWRRFSDAGELECRDLGFWARAPGANCRNGSGSGAGAVAGDRERLAARISSTGRKRVDAGTEVPAFVAQLEVVVHREQDARHPTHDDDVEDKSYDLIGD